jgi:hypothetical protein
MRKKVKTIPKFASEGRGKSVLGKERFDCVFGLEKSAVQCSLTSARGD